MASKFLRESCQGKIKPNASSSETNVGRERRQINKGDGALLSKVEPQQPHYLKPTLSSMGGAVACSCRYGKMHSSNEVLHGNKGHLIRRLSMERPAPKSKQHEINGRPSTASGDKHTRISYPLKGTTKSCRSNFAKTKDQEIPDQIVQVQLLVGKETIDAPKLEQEDTKMKSIELPFDKHCVSEKLEDSELPVNLTENSEVQLEDSKLAGNLTENSKVQLEDSKLSGNLTEKSEGKENGVENFMNKDEGVDSCEKTNTHKNSEANYHTGNKGMSGNRKILAEAKEEEEKARRLNFRQGSYIDAVEDSTNETENVVLKRQEGNEKKEFIDYNGVIEETASKLVEQKKNKVLALAGAFETVISLQESEGLVQNKKET